MYPIDLTGKNGIVFGVANHRSIAWFIPQMLDKAGARLAITYQNERLGQEVQRLAPQLKEPLLVQCDVVHEEEIASAFSKVKEGFGKLDIATYSIAFAHRDDLGGDFSKT